jgi:hypothetical protein
MQEGPKARSARRLALAAGWGGGVLLAAVVVFDTAWPMGAQGVRQFMTPGHMTLHYLAVLFWLMGSVALCASVVALAVHAASAPRWSRWAFAACVVVALVGGLYGLRFLAHADMALKLPGLAPVWQPWVQAQSWLVWVRLVVLCSFVLDLVLLVAAVLFPSPAVLSRVTGSASPAAASGTPAASADDMACVAAFAPDGASDVAALRLAFWMAAAALVAILLDAVRTHVWSSDLVRAMNHAAFAKQQWLTTAVVLLAQTGWLVPPLLVTWRARRATRVSWAVLGAAGAYGLLVYAEALMSSVRGWSSAYETWRQFERALANGLGGWTLRLHQGRDELESLREQALAGAIFDAVLLVLALLLIVAAVRQYLAWRSSRAASVASSIEARQVSAVSGRWSRRDLGLAAVAVVAVVLTVTASTIAEAMVDKDGSLLGAGGANPRVLPGVTATEPSPVPVASGSPLPQKAPVVIGVVPGAGTTGVKMWRGDTVGFTYHPLGFLIHQGRCELFINGQKQDVQASSPSEMVTNPTLVWKLKTPLGSGGYQFTVVLVTTGGQRFAYRWSFSD